MHSQAKLVKYLKTIRNLIVNQHRLYEQDTARRSELGLCDANIRAWRADSSNTDMKAAVKEMIRAQFDVVGVKHDEYTYLYPIRTGYSTAVNAKGTLEEVAAGYAARLATVDKWIEDAERKLVAAIFTSALDRFKSGAGQFMCNELRRASRSLLGYDRAHCVDNEPAHIKAMETLALFHPRTGKDAENPWWANDSIGRAMRVATLNLCITMIKRGTV